MRKITLLLILLTVSLGYSQTLPFDFESAPVTADFVDFNGGAASVIPNPDPAGNASATVAQLVRDGGEVWAGSQVILDAPIDFTANNSISMKVWTAAPIGTNVTLKLEDSGSGGATFVEVPVATTVTSAWETLEFDLTGQPNGTYDAVVFLFDLGNLGDGTASSTYYFDDVMQFNAAAGPMLPVLPFDFETEPVTMDFADFNGGTASVIANPDPAGNSSTMVAQLVRDGGEVWAGSQIIIDAPVDFSTNNAISMKVWTAAPIGTNVTLKLEDSGSGGATFIEVPAATTVTSAWETLEFDLTGQPSNTYNAVVFLFDLGNLGDGTASSTFYFDDVQQFNSSGGLDQIDLPVTFEGSTTDYTVTDFGNNVSTLVVDPTDGSNMVMRSVKTAAAETWAGTTIGTPAGFANPIPITTNDTKMNVRVWSPEAGLPIMLKIETAGTPTQSCETLTSTTVNAGWNTLEFDFNNERPGTAALNTSFTFDLASIFFNFDVSGATAGEKTFYFDDVLFGEALSTNEFNTVSFKVFPNPTKENWNITGTTTISKIAVYDVLGKKVMSLAPNSTDAVINTSSLNTGMYFAKIESANGSKTVKLIKE
jgi:hypothetical protein